MLKAAGYLPVTYDNLSNGWEWAVKYGPFEQGDLMDRDRLDQVFAQYRPDAVMHFGAFIEVGESYSNPGKYWRNNVLGSLTLIEATVAAGCKNFVFSSTCATYGDQDNVVLDETAGQYPVNAYASSKRAVEEILRDFETAHGLRHVIFRYFNVAGADPEGELGECHQPETHLIPIILQVINGEREALSIYGTDYDTPDGTGVRDYVHVVDLVQAHILGLKRLEEGGASSVYNLGTGHGFSVREVAEAAKRITNQPLNVVETARRGGDCAKLVSGSTKAINELGWNPQHSTLDRMIADAWQWHQKQGNDR